MQRFQTEGTLDDYLGQESLLIEFSRTMPNVFNMRILLKVDAEMLADENFLVRYCAPYNTIAFHTEPNQTIIYGIAPMVIHHSVPYHTVTYPRP